MKKIGIVYGLISGAIISSLMGIAMAVYYSSSSKMEHSMVLGYASMLLAFSLIFVGIKAYRDKQNGGVITFWKGLQIGLLISVIASAIYVATWALEYKYAFPDFMDKYGAQEVAKVKSSGAPQADIDKQLVQLKWYKDNYNNPIFFTLLTFVEIFPVGLVVSLIAALILKKKNNTSPAV